MIKIEIPDFEENSMGVYAIIFDDYYAYIGSSVNLKDRMKNWKFNLSRRKPISKKMTSIIMTFKKVEIKIIEMIQNKDHLQTVEGYYINYGCELGLFKEIINSRDAYSGPIGDLSKSFNLYGHRKIPNIDKPMLLPE